MKFYTANESGPIPADAPHDPDAELFYGFKYKPEVWQPNTVYRKDKQIVMPSVFNGFQYQIVSNGKSGSSEPVWPTVKREIIDDGTVRFKAVEYNLYLGDSETLVSSSWEATNGVPVTNEAFTAEGEALAMFGPIPDDVCEFVITNHIETSSGEKDDRSMIIEVLGR